MRPDTIPQLLAGTDQPGRIPDRPFFFEILCGSAPAKTVDLVHGFERVVFEDFFANLIPDVFLRVQLRGIRWEQTAGLGPWNILFGHSVEKYLEAFGVGCRQDQKDATPILG